MKKILLIATIMLLSGGLFSQNIFQPQQAGAFRAVGAANFSAKTPTDTIFMDDFYNLGQPVIYSYNPIGYIFGTGWDSTGSQKAPEVAQGYIMNFTTGYNIEEILIWVSDKSQASANGSTLSVKVAKIDGTSSYGPGGTPTYTISCPGTVLGTTSVGWASIDTSDFTIAQLSSPVYVNSDYAVVLNFDDFYVNDDTIGVVCSADGGGSALNGIEYTWWKYRTTSGSFWAQLSHIFTIQGAPMDVGIAIFPVVNASAGIVDGSSNFINGLQLGQNSPNPAITGTAIPYALEKASNVKIEIIDLKGNLVLSMDEGIQSAGSHNLYINNNLAAGTYYYSVVAGNSRLTKKMTFSK